MRNLELKVYCADEVVQAALVARAHAGGALFRRTMWQRDTYFIASQARLKLREWSRRDDGLATTDSDHADNEAGATGAVLIAYGRPDAAGSRYSDYTLSPTNTPAQLRQALVQALGVLVVVEKERQLWQYDHTRVHFDRVAGLGAFIELETVLDHFPRTAETAAGEAQRQAAAEAEHQAAIALLGLDCLPVIAGSYSDLLLAQQREA